MWGILKLSPHFSLTIKPLLSECCSFTQMNKLNFTKHVKRSLPPLSMMLFPDFFHFSLGEGGFSPARRAWQEGCFGACSPHRFVALAGITHCPHTHFQAGAGVWLGCLGTAEGEVGSSMWSCSGKAKGALWKAAGELAVVAQQAMPTETSLRLPAPPEQSLALSVAERFERKVASFKQTKIRFSPGCGQV